MRAKPGNGDSLTSATQLQFRKSDPHRSLHFDLPLAATMDILPVGVEAAFAAMPT
jgi:hypothetical protein